MNKQKSDLIKMGVALSLIGITVLAFRSKDTIQTSQELLAGNNTFNYIGVKQKAGPALSPITEYIETAYYYAGGNIWASVTADTDLVSGMTLNIKVSQDCTWTYEIENV